MHRARAVRRPPGMEVLCGVQRPRGVQPLAEGGAQLLVAQCAAPVEWVAQEVELRRQRGRAEGGHTTLGCWRFNVAGRQVPACRERPRAELQDAMRKAVRTPPCRSEAHGSLPACWPTKTNRSPLRSLCSFLQKATLRLVLGPTIASTETLPREARPTRSVSVIGSYIHR
eukprot:scaffold41220_cov71-Phaeocystis_antarctica.AAC.2